MNTDNNVSPAEICTGIPGLRGSDHIGFTVPDIDQAHEFLTVILGAIFVYRLGPYPKGPTIAEKLDIATDAVMEEIRFYRLHTGINLEVFHYNVPDQRMTVPQNSDVGGHHLALYVDNIPAAVEFLHSHDVEVLGSPTQSSGPSAGQEWVYFKSPWGMYFELVSFPHGKAYETAADTVLWDPRQPND